MTQVARITTWPTIDSLQAPALNNEFNNFINAWNNTDAGIISWTNLSVSGTVAFAGGVTGTQTNDSAATGRIGEYKESVVGLTNLPATTVVGDLTSLSLTAGDWDVTANVFFISNGATYTAIDLEIAITSTTGNSTTGIVNGSNQAEFNPGAAFTIFTSVSLCVPSFRVSLASTTTYYLKVYAGAYSAGTPQAAGRLSARRPR